MYLILICIRSLNKLLIVLQNLKCTFKIYFIKQICDFLQQGDHGNYKWPTPYVVTKDGDYQGADPDIVHFVGYEKHTRTLMSTEICYSHR